MPSQPSTPRRLGAVLLLAGCLAVSIGGCSDSTAATARTIAAPTSSPLVSAHAPALLGSPESAFEAAFGRPDEHSLPNLGRYNFQSYGSNGDHVTVYLGTFYGYPYKQAFSISVAPKPATNWTVAEATAACLAFAPRPVHYEKHVTWEDVPGYVSGMDEVYSSATLTRLFPPQAFRDVELNTVAPGTFDVLLYYTQFNDPSAVDECSIAVGEEQTK